MPRTTSKSFLAKCDTSGGPDACWPFGGFVSRRYGVVSIGNRPVRSNRAAYMLLVGPIPDGMYVCHTCDNPVCCNPAHLWLGSPQENSDDARAKRRHAHNERAPASRLTATQVVEIDRLMQEGFSYRSIAAEYGVTTSLLARIRGRRVWKSVFFPDYYAPKFECVHTPERNQSRRGAAINRRNRFTFRDLPASYVRVP